MYSCRYFRIGIHRSEFINLNHPAMQANPIQLDKKIIRWILIEARRFGFWAIKRSCPDFPFPTILKPQKLSRPKTSAEISSGSSLWSARNISSGLWAISAKNPEKHKMKNINKLRKVFGILFEELSLMDVYGIRPAQEISAVD